MEPRVRALTPQIGYGLALAAAFLALFWPTFVWMAQRFGTADSLYSHGWLIPLASGWLVWQRRDTLAHNTASSAWGLALLVPAVLIHVLASWWHLGFVSGFAMVASVWGLVWMLWGGSVLRTLRLPLLFLLFMVPLPGILLITTTFQMKLLAASLATPIVNLLGIPARQAGSTIHVPGISVIVDDACSGLRSLVSLIALSTFWMAFMPASANWRQKALVVAASIPIALAANIVRIVILVCLSAIYGAWIAETFLHYGSGIVVFGVAALLLMWLTKWLVRTV